MSVIAFVLLLIAAVLFAVEFLRSNWQSLVALGLCLLTVGIIVQWCSTHHTVIF